MNQITTKVFFQGSEKNLQEYQIDISEAKPRIVKYWGISENGFIDPKQQERIPEATHLLTLSEGEVQKENLEREKLFVFALSRDQLVSLAEAILSEFGLEIDGGSF